MANLNHFMTIWLVQESDLKMSKSHANVVSFDEFVLFVHFNELMLTKGTFFMNETAIELTGQTLAPLYNIVI